MNPWIFRQSKSLLESKDYDEPSIEERIDICIDHLKLCCDLKGEERGTLEFRKHYSGYLRNLKDISKFRMELMELREFAPLKEKLENFKKGMLAETQN